MQAYILPLRNIDEFIEHIKHKSDVVGIVEYGGRTHNSMELGGDYDLTIIFDKPISRNFNGVHFHIGAIPVDCMLLSVEDFLTDEPSNDFMLVHLNCKILYDRDGTTQKLLDRIKAAWKASESLSDSEIATFRFTFKHILDKLEYRLHENELYSRYFIFANFDWFLECYSRIKNLEVGKPKAHLSYIKNNEPELFSVISQLYSSDDLEIQFLMLKKCAELMLASIGGLWGKDEVLFHIVPDGKSINEEQKNIIMRLLSVDKEEETMFEFKELDYLTDGEIDLKLEEKTPANEEKGYVPAYRYRITLHGLDETIGAIDIRIGYNENIYYGGNIGYGIKEAYRGHNYASKACKIIRSVALAHGMDRIIITCNPDNLASRKTCEKAGLKLKEIADLPPYNDLYKEGDRQECIYEWIL